MEIRCDYYTNIQRMVKNWVWMTGPGTQWFASVPWGLSPSFHQSTYIGPFLSGERREIYPELVYKSKGVHLLYSYSSSERRLTLFKLIDCFKSTAYTIAQSHEWWKCFGVFKNALCAVVVIKSVGNKSHAKVWRQFSATKQYPSFLLIYQLKLIY